MKKTLFILLSLMISLATSELLNFVLVQAKSDIGTANIFKTSQYIDILPGSGKGAIQIMAIPDVFQSTPYTCGPSALSALLNYYGYMIREDKVAQSAKTIPYKGTGPRNLTLAAKSLVKDPNSVELIQDMKVVDLSRFLKSKIPVIVLIQVDKQNKQLPWEDYWLGGHYMVVMGEDNDNFYLEDPWIIGSITYIPKSQFQSRWHDVISSEERKVYGAGIIIHETFKGIPTVIRKE